MIIIVLLVMKDVLDGNTKEPKMDEFVVHLTIIILNRACSPSSLLFNGPKIN